MRLRVQKVDPTQIPSEFDFAYHLKAVRGQPKGFYRVQHPIAAFKKVFVYDKGCNHQACIANMVIPVGAHVFIGTKKDTYPGDADVRDVVSLTNSGKMRATHGYVHSIYKVETESNKLPSHGLHRAHEYTAHFTKCATPIMSDAHSWYSACFKYIPDTVVDPVWPFSYHQDSCTTGIHFYLTLEQALNF